MLAAEVFQIKWDLFKIPFPDTNGPSDIWCSSLPTVAFQPPWNGFCSAAVAPSGACGFTGVNVCWEVLGNPHGKRWVTVTGYCSLVLHQSRDVNTINKRVPSLDRATLLLWIWTFKRTAARMRCVPLQPPCVNGLLMKQGNSRNQSCWHLILL